MPAVDLEEPEVLDRLGEGVALARGEDVPKRGGITDLVF